MSYHLGQRGVEHVLLERARVAERWRTQRWATGYSLDLDWIDLPIFDERRRPIHRRGVTPSPGIYLLGLAWLHKRKSSFLYGVGEDAEYIAEHMALRHDPARCP